MICMSHDALARTVHSTRVSGSTLFCIVKNLNTIIKEILIMAPLAFRVKDTEMFEAKSVDLVKFTQTLAVLSLHNCL